MADWHLEDIRHALERSGWKIVAEEPGDGDRIAPAWEIVRSTKDRGFSVYFDGQGDLKLLPLMQCYGCHIQGYTDVGLYFSKKGSKGSNHRTIWKENLRAFIDQLNELT